MSGESKNGIRLEGALRDRRHAIRYPFAADADILELSSGERASGVTCDISLGGCFVCTRRQLPVGARVRLVLSRKGEKVEVLAMVRVAKPRLGMGLEFLDVDSASRPTLHRWMERLRSSR